MVQLVLNFMGPLFIYMAIAYFLYHLLPIGKRQTHKKWIRGYKIVCLILSVIITFLTVLYPELDNQYYQFFLAFIVSIEVTDYIFNVDY